MKIFLSTLLIFHFFSFFIHVYAAITPEQLVQMADDIRNPSDSYQMKIKVDTPENNSIFQVYLKGKEKTLIVTKEPSRDKGRNMLMIGSDFFAYVPNLKRSMRLSLAQKLSGQVANGDISRTRWSGDYSVQKESETKSETQLLLKANKENLTYAWIRLWVNKKGQPQRAQYLTLDGKTILKTAIFLEYKQIADSLRPTTLKIEDTNKQVSYIHILSMEKKEFKDSFFTNRNMESQN